MAEQQRRPFFGYLVALVGVILLLTSPIVLFADGRDRFNALKKFHVDHELDTYKYSLAGPLCATILWNAGIIFDETERFVGCFNRILFIGFLIAHWIAIRPILGERDRLRFTLFLLFGSLFSWHALDFYGEMFQTCCLCLGLTLVVVRDARLGWPLAIYGTVNIPGSILGFACAVLVICWQTRKLRYLIAPWVVFGLFLFENWIRRGDPFNTGYTLDHGYSTALPYSGLPNFSYPLFFGLLSILFSFGKGLVFFTPGLFLSYTGRDETMQRVYRIWIAVVVGLVLMYARWWAWYGGAIWGPRFFLFASLPASLVLAHRTLRSEEQSLRLNLLVLLATLLSCWVAANSVVFNLHGVRQFFENGYQLESLTWYVPECSVLWWPFVHPKPLEWFDYLRLSGFAIGFAYLAWPVMNQIAKQLWAQFREVRQAFPKFRI